MRTGCPLLHGPRESTHTLTARPPHSLHRVRAKQAHHKRLRTVQVLPGSQP